MMRPNALLWVLASIGATLAACTSVRPLDRSIEDIKALIAGIKHCQWETSGPEEYADRKKVMLSECDGDRLGVADGGFMTYETYFMNPDERFGKKDFPDKYMPLVIATVTALLPEWRDGRTWLETNMNLGMNGDSRIVSEKVDNVWVVVESYGVAGSGMSKNGVTVVFVTKDPDVAKHGNGHHSED
jgi:hypothetical protein